MLSNTALIDHSTAKLLQLESHVQLNVLLLTHHLILCFICTERFHCNKHHWLYCGQVALVLLPALENALISLSVTGIYIQYDLVYYSCSHIHRDCDIYIFQSTIKLQHSEQSCAFFFIVSKISTVVSMYTQWQHNQNSKIIPSTRQPTSVSVILHGKS